MQSVVTGYILIHNNETLKTFFVMRYVLMQTDAGMFIKYISDRILT
jgi:hypothetical protein